MRMVVLSVLGVSSGWACRSVPGGAASGDESYEFLGRLTRIVMLSEFEGRTAVADSDPRWVVEFAPVKIDRGVPPAGKDGVIRYAIHSPALLGLTGHVGADFRIQGELVGDESHRHHRIEVKRQAP